MQTMNTQPPRVAAPAGGVQPPAQGAPTGGLPSQGLTPDQVRKMQIMARQAMQFLTKGNTAAMILQQCQQGRPEQVVSDVVVKIMQQLWQAASAAGQQVDMVTVLVTGLQIIGDITELLVKAGVVHQSQAPLFIGTVSRLAIQKHNAQVQQQGSAAPPQAAAPAPQPQQGGMQ